MPAPASRALREPLEPLPEPVHVRPPPREELAAEAPVEPGATDDVGHEGVAGHE